jgi:hypothetical protein
MQTTVNLQAIDSFHPVTQMRVDAEIVLRGPDGIAWQHDNDGYWGGLTLHLGKRQYRSDYNESISVYTDLFNNTMSFAVVRIVNWHGQNARKNLRNHPTDFQLKLNAKFVEVPKTWVIEWVNRFPSISTMPGDYVSAQDPEIRRIKLVLGNAVHAFEKVWIDRGEPDTLNEVWEEMWEKIMEVSINIPNMDRVTESFTYRTPNVVYEFATS